MYYGIKWVHCGNCNESHGEDSIAECPHCEKDCCPSCGDIEHDGDNNGYPHGYHTACRLWVDGESDVDPCAEIQIAQP